jgi:hypothetical protein
LPELPTAWIDAIQGFSTTVTPAGTINAEGYVEVTERRARNTVEKAISDLQELTGFGGAFKNKVFGLAFALARQEIAQNGSVDDVEELMEKAFSELPNHPGLCMDDNDRKWMHEGIAKGLKEPWRFVPETVFGFPEEELMAQHEARQASTLPAVALAATLSANGAQGVTTAPALAVVPPMAVQGAEDPVTALLGELLDVEGLANRPKAAPLIEGWMVRNSLARLSGHPGSYKSFLALDWAAHVGLGRAWHGHRVTKGAVVYLVGEGEEGIYRRVRAWEIHHKAKLKDAVRFLPRPIQTAGPEWETFCRAMAQIRPALIVLDTQARVTVGVNENDPTEFGEVIERWDALRRFTGATVLLLHHLNATGDRPRGSTAVPGALQSEFEIEKQGDAGKRTVKITNGKQKDQAEHEPLTLRVRVVDVEAAPVAAVPTDPSAVPDGPVMPISPVTSVFWNTPRAS